MLTASPFNTKHIHALFALCILFGVSGGPIAGPRDSNADDGKSLDSNAADTTTPKLLHGPISIEENMRLRRDLDEYSRTVDPAHVQIEERRRLMHQRIQTRFAETDKDNDGKISLIEATESLPQVARHFNSVDTNNDGYITLDELEGLQARIVERQRAEAIKVDANPPPAEPENAAAKRKNKDAMLSSRKHTL